MRILSLFFVFFLILSCNKKDNSDMERLKSHRYSSCYIYTGYPMEIRFYENNKAFLTHSYVLNNTEMYDEKDVSWTYDLIDDVIHLKSIKDTTGKYNFRFRFYDEEVYSPYTMDHKTINSYLILKDIDNNNTSEMQFYEINPNF